jgi:hypothetical protein
MSSRWGRPRSSNLNTTKAFRVSKAAEDWAHRGKPHGRDREMQVAPPNGGRLKVIPPPGTPGGDQSVQPK